MNRILVTGAAGMIGSNIAGVLADAGREVVACDRFGDSEAGKWRNLARHPICDFVAPENLFAYLETHKARIGAVVHMGAISSTTERDVDLIVASNINLSQRLWDWCALARKPLVYASSAATYGDGSQGFRDDNSFEALARLRPLNAYGWSKQMFDLYAVREAARGHAPPLWSGLKFFNVYGPNEQHKGSQKSVVAHAFPRAAAGEPMTLFRAHHPDYSDGGQKRDFIYVRDCAEIVHWLLDAEKQGGVLNVGTGQARSFLDLANALFAALGKAPNIVFVDTPEDIRAKYQYFTEADMNRLVALGWNRQFTPLEAGVADYVKTYLVSDNSHA